MPALAASKLRAMLADTLNRVVYRGERIRLKRRGKEIAAIISREDLELLEALEEQADLQAARKALKEQGSTAWEHLRDELEH